MGMGLQQCCFRILYCSLLFLLRLEVLLTRFALIGFQFCQVSVFDFPVSSWLRKFFSLCVTLFISWNIIASLAQIY